MPDINILKLSPKINLSIGYDGKNGQGGEGGQVLIVCEKIKGSGTISTDGGNGLIGGKGGKIFIKTKQNLFNGKVSAKGGKAVIKNGKK